jgi:hypothetical protein
MAKRNNKRTERSIEEIKKILAEQEKELIEARKKRTKVRCYPNFSKFSYRKTKSFLILERSEGERSAKRTGRFNVLSLI